MIKIALDFDDVLSNTMGRWVEIFNEKYKDTKSKDRINTWDLCGYFGIDENERDCLFVQSWSDIHALLPLHDDLSEQSRQLCSFGTVDIVTGINPNYLSTVSRWAEKHKIEFSKIVSSTEKEKLDYHYYIDDDFRLAGKLSGTAKHCFLYNQAWNANVNNDRNVTRINSLSDVIELLNSQT